MKFSKATRQNSTSFQSLQCYKNRTCTRWRFVLRLYTIHCSFVRPFTGYITPLSRAFGHFITCLLQLLLQTGLQPLRDYLAGLLTILEALNKLFRGVSKIATDRLRQCTDISSILPHFSLLVVLLVLQSPNEGINNFAVSIA